MEWILFGVFCVVVIAWLYTRKLDTMRQIELDKLACQHKWQIIHERRANITEFGSVVGTKYMFTMQCTKCGEVKAKHDYVGC